jgi:hypothetical protein
MAGRERDIDDACFWALAVILLCFFFSSALSSPSFVPFVAFCSHFIPAA